MGFQKRERELAEESKKIKGQVFALQEENRALKSRMRAVHEDAEKMKQALENRNKQDLQEYNGLNEDSELKSSNAFKNVSQVDDQKLEENDRGDQSESPLAPTCTTRVLFRRRTPCCVNKSSKQCCQRLRAR